MLVSQRLTLVLSRWYDTGNTVDTGFLLIISDAAITHPTNLVPYLWYAKRWWGRKTAWSLAQLQEYDRRMSEAFSQEEDRRMDAAVAIQRAHYDDEPRNSVARTR